MQINCSTTSANVPIDWRHKPVGSGTTVFFFEDGKFSNNSYTQRFRIEISSGHYNLIIQDVHLDDSGTYYCVDRAGIGDSAQADLVVLGDIFYVFCWILYFLNIIHTFCFAYTLEVWNLIITMESIAESTPFQQNSHHYHHLNVYFFQD